MKKKQWATMLAAIALAILCLGSNCLELEELEKIATNQPPVLEVNTPLEVYWGQNFVIDPVVTDQDGNSVQCNCSGWIEQPVPCSYTPLQEERGSHQVTVSCSDGISLISAKITVKVLNYAPVVDTVTLTPLDPYADDVIFVDYTAHDPEGDDFFISYQWLINGGVVPGETAHLLPPGYTAHFDQVSVEVAATDTFNDTGLRSANVEVLNTSPSLNLPATLPVKVLTLFYYPVDTQDPDKDIVTCYLLQGPTGLSLDPLECSFIWAPDAGDIGGNTVLARPYDGFEWGSTVVFNIQVENDKWQKFNIPASPPARWLTTLSFDPNNNRAVMFGGVAGGEAVRGVTAYSDIWSLNNLGSSPSWTQLVPTGTGPTVRYGVAACTNPDNGVMGFFGGNRTTTVSCSDSGGCGCSCSKDCNNQTPYAETYSYQYTALPNGSWQSGPVLNSKSRYGASMIYDTNGKYIIWGGKWVTDETPWCDPTCCCVIFCWCCGCDTGCSASSTTYDDSLFSVVGSSWQDLSLTQSGDIPSKRAWHSSVYDPEYHRMLLYGGWTGSGRDPDVYALDLSTYQWTILDSDTADGPPVARQSHGAVYDSFYRRMMVLGGYDGTSYRNDVWFLDFGLCNCPEGKWIPASPDSDPTAGLPTGRSGFGYTWDSINHQMVIFGGQAISGFLNEVWVLK